MPLSRPHTKEDTHRNIAELIRSGKPQDQAVAIAIQLAKKKK